MPRVASTAPAYALIALAVVVGADVELRVVLAVVPAYEFVDYPVVNYGESGD